MSKRYTIVLSDAAAAEIELWRGRELFLIPSPWGDEPAARVEALSLRLDGEPRAAQEGGEEDAGGDVGQAREHEGT